MNYRLKCAVGITKDQAHKLARALEAKYNCRAEIVGKRKFSVYGHFEVDKPTLAFGAGVFDFTHEEVLKGVIFWD
jgi:hypothetical protein